MRASSSLSRSRTVAAYLRLWPCNRKGGARGRKGATCGAKATKTAMQAKSARGRNKGLATKRGAALYTGAARRWAALLTAPKGANTRLYTMAKTAKTAPAAATVAAPATVAPQTAPAATPAAPAALVWANPQHTQGQKAATAALQSMAAQGAYIVRLPATTSKLQTLLSGIAGNAALVATLPALVGSNAGGWAAFNVGYMGGANASYAACAAQHGNKKAKANPAFAYALPCGTLLTASGNVWAQPAANAPAHVLQAWQVATAAVAMAQQGGAMPAPQPAAQAA